MELLLALLLAVALVALASTWSDLRTERARRTRLEDRIAAAPLERAAPPVGQEPEAAPLPPRPVDPPSPGPGPEVPSAPVAQATPSPVVDRLAAALVSPSERLAESIQASEPALAAAAERLRTPVPPPATAAGLDDAPAPEFRVESVDRAVSTAERISDERNRLTDDVRSLRSALERIASLDGGLGRGMSELSRTADALLPLASSVSSLADRANLLGLNVSLLAARAGESGAPFEEAATELRGLFEEARRLSRDLSDAARRTSGSARRIATFVEESAGAVADGQERGARAAERLGALGGLCSQLDRTLSEAARSARTASDEGARLARRLETARASLDARASESARLRADAEAARAALRMAAERIEALRVDGGALRAAVSRVTSAA